jgi:hypothetical protein
MSTNTRAAVYEFPSIHSYRDRLPTSLYKADARMHCIQIYTPFFLDYDNIYPFFFPLKGVHFLYRIASNDPGMWASPSFNAIDNNLISILHNTVEYSSFSSYSPSLWHNRLEALTADQKVWGSISTRAKAK